jgi:hypothetical protein
VRRLVVLTGTGACVLALAGSSGATIVIGHGIAGVRLQMTQPQVRGKLGRPVKVVKAKSEFGLYTEFRYRGYVVDFQNNERVTSIVTTLAREKTPAGVGVGSTWAQVSRKVPHLRCEGSALLGDCHVGQLLPGRTVTDFFFKFGKVSRVLVGIVLD